MSIDAADAVRSREELAQFVRGLVAEFEQGAEWENRDLGRFLEALGGWVNDMDGYFQNRGEPVPEQPSWKTLAQILSAARYYE